MQLVSQILRRKLTNTIVHYLFFNSITSVTPGNMCLQKMSANTLYLINTQNRFGGSNEILHNLNRPVD